MSFFNYMICCLLGHKISDLDEDGLDIFKSEKLNIKCVRCEESLIIYNDPRNPDYYYVEED